MVSAGNMEKAGTGQVNLVEAALQPSRASFPAPVFGGPLPTDSAVGFCPTVSVAGLYTAITLFPLVRDVARHYCACLRRYSDT